MWANVFSCLFLTLGAWIVAVNWACTAANYMLPQSAKRDVCAVPFAAQVFVAVAALISSCAASPLLSAWIFWVVALTDVSLLQLFGFHGFPAVSEQKSARRGKTASERLMSTFKGE
jgi:hypothetical protein